MKKKLFTVLFVLLAVVLLTGCGKKEEIKKDEPVVGGWQLNTEVKGTLMRDEDRYEDYELSFFFGEVDRNRYFETDNRINEKFVYMKGFIPTAQSIYDWFMEGSTDQEADNTLINNFRTAMINYN